MFLQKRRKQKRNLTDSNYFQFSKFCFNNKKKVKEYLSYQAMSIHANITLFQNRYTNHINLLTWSIFSKLIYVQVPRIIYYSHIDMKISNHLLFVYFLCKYHWLKEWKGVLFFSYDLFYKIICILRSRICFWASIVQINEFIIMGIVKMSIALLLILKDQEVKKKKKE